jgi:hypothetical protein
MWRYIKILQNVLFSLIMSVVVSFFSSMLYKTVVLIYTSSIKDVDLIFCLTIIFPSLCLTAFGCYVIYLNIMEVIDLVNKPKN